MSTTQTLTMTEIQRAMRETLISKYLKEGKDVDESRRMAEKVIYNKAQRKAAGEAQRKAAEADAQRASKHAAERKAQEEAVDKLVKAGMTEEEAIQKVESNMKKNKRQPKFEFGGVATNTYNVSKKASGVTTKKLDRELASLEHTLKNKKADQEKAIEEYGTEEDEDPTHTHTVFKVIETFVNDINEVVTSNTFKAVAEVITSKDRKKRIRFMSRAKNVSNCKMMFASQRQKYKMMVKHFQQCGKHFTVIQNANKAVDDQEKKISEKKEKIEQAKKSTVEVNDFEFSDSDSEEDMDV
eukprot:TRINITY_DN1003_c0_g1_i1.p1 TRINITY_DN1003_c0_g1~~TRINITY_DN1003_c0_g1_i1.p1  ORF type:complete len:297 (-),score=114.22 TRINITY_DN1003_c0_g1_i1:588-1478(-)